MVRFLALRMVYMAVVMLGVTALVFVMSRSSGDPRYFYMSAYSRPGSEAWEARGRAMNLDRALPMQFLLWARDAATGNFGDSILYNRNSLGVIKETAGATLQLSVVAFLGALLIGIPLGILSAVSRGTLWDLGGRLFALIGQAAPPFLIGIILIFVFGVKLGWLPTSLRGDWTHFVLPAFTLAWLGSAGLVRLTRSAMLEVLDSEYIKLARAKGVSRTMIIWKHAFRNAMIAPLTLAALWFAGFFTGTVVVETVFAWPGLGRLAVQAALNTDFPLITGLALISAAIYLFSSLVADLLYAAIDPRVRIS